MGAYFRSPMGFLGRVLGGWLLFVDIVGQTHRFGLAAVVGFRFASTCSARKMSASSRKVDARRSAALAAAGSLPCATAPSVLRARARASSGVRVPTLPSVTRRVGAPRPEPARYLTM